MRGIARGFLYLIYIVLVGGLLAAIILTFHHNEASAPSPSRPRQTASAPAKKPAAKPGNTAASRPSGAPSQPQSSAPQKSAAPSGQPSGQAAALTNTGPGDTLGLFAAASLTGAWLKRRLIIRRQS